ncbi:expressed unknown protein [Seminavis robusta]|uniref:Uncharacterized protein n=1 Tax=Seminavis robusta TaxID=568900 RepID=A0A9N8HP33_9STRA|nr:expressed unknown protein [Seminavis robusta]|eukprot:Sro1050_g235470.1 n/a (97) ;mRNA; r:6487-6777
MPSSMQYIATIGVGFLGLCVGVSVTYYNMEMELKRKEKMAELRRKNDIQTLEVTLAKQREVIKKLRGSLALAMKRPMISSPLSSPLSSPDSRIRQR